MDRPNPSSAKDRAGEPGEVAVVGLGAVGGAILAHLASAGRHRLVGCTRTGFEDLTVATPAGVLHARPRVLTEPSRARPASWVLLAVKAQQTAASAPWLSALIGADTRVAVLQNGVEHRERVEPFARGATVLPVVVDCPSERSAPGRVVQRAPARLVVPESAAGASFAELFAGTAVDVAATTDFLTAAWRKLCLNVAGGALTTLTNRTLEVMHRPDVLVIARELVRECAEVGRAEGAGIDAGIEDEVVSALLASRPGAGTSMLSDLRAGRGLEIDARNGAVVRIAARHGIPTPTSRTVAALLAALSP